MIVDDFIVQASDARSFARFEGTTAEFKLSSMVVDWCIREKKIVRLSPQEMSRKDKDRYTDYLVSLLKSYLKSHSEISSWVDFASRKENIKIQSLFHQFGVRGEVFGFESFKEDDTKTERSKTNLTFEEFYEMCQIQFHYQGSFGSFKKMIARKYGSFAEYCVDRGYDINGTRWDSNETALRVAKKLGSLEAIKLRAVSLYKYLSEKGLLEQAFDKKIS